jgi:hypothetical protein
LPFDVKFKLRPLINSGPGYRGRYNDSLWVERSGDRIPLGARFSAPVQSGPGAYPASCTVGTRSLVAGAWRWLSTPSSAEVKEWVELHLYFPLSAFMTCSRVKFTFALPTHITMSRKCMIGGGKAPYALNLRMKTPHSVHLAPVGLELCWTLTTTALTSVEINFQRLWG